MDLIKAINASDRPTAELQGDLGRQLRLLRLRQSIDQRQLAREAGVALNVVKRLESGRGATLKSLIKVLRVLGRADWLGTLSPPVSISPLQMVKANATRQRASAKKKSRGV
jgi:transcriptional regulator with XRE-family HTH domain